MDEIKNQLQYFINLLDEDFKFTKTEIDGKIIYYIFDEEGIPVIDLGVYLR